MIKTILEGWDHLTWNELLADDIVLSFRSGKGDVSGLGEVRGYGSVFQATGKREVKHVLTSMYGDLRQSLSVTTEFISGYHVILFGKLVVQRMIGHIESLPVAIYLDVNLERKIQKMTISNVGPLTRADANRKVPEYYTVPKRGRARGRGTYGSER